MNHISQPPLKPTCPNFSSGPCAKRPGWDLSALRHALLGRSHRAAPAKSQLAEVIQLSASILGLPAGWKLGIVPASDTGAIEMAMWNLLGARPVTVLAWDAFGKEWVQDIIDQLRIPAQCREAEYGDLPALNDIPPGDDVVFVWNGTTSGVKLPDADWLAEGRSGLAICDATSAVFAMELPYNKLDVVTWSWQKILGGEGGHGMIALSPKAQQRLLEWQPPWPLPKIFRLSKGGKIIDGIFAGDTINTPSMLCVADALDGLHWAQSIGGLAALVKRSRSNLAIIEEFVQRAPWLEFLANNARTRSNSSVCLKLVGLSDPVAAQLVKKITERLDGEKVAFDIANYRDAPPGLRIWCGATVEAEDIKRLMPWLEWAYQQAYQEVVA